MNMKEFLTTLSIEIIINKILPIAESYIFQFEMDLILWLLMLEVDYAIYTIEGMV